jgi:MYXO-CTERM domain-containing protein
MRKIMIAAAAALALSATGANAQTDADNTVDTSYGDPQPREDDDFPWGLLGLLGLAGLIPRKKAPDVHIDNRTNTPR